MKNLSLTFCLAIAALLGSVGSGFATEHLPKCPGCPVPLFSQNYEKMWETWNNCLGKVTMSDGGSFYNGEFKNGLWNGQGAYQEIRNEGDIKKYCVGKTVYSDIFCDFASRKRYIGNWKEDYRTGYGIQTYWDGSIKEGIWNRNRFQYSFKPPKMSLLQNAFMQLSEIQRKQLQAKLTDLGFYKSSIDGIYGKGTEGALNSYNEKRLSKSDLSRGKNVEHLIKSVLGIKDFPTLKKAIVDKTPPKQKSTIKYFIVEKDGEFVCVIGLDGKISAETVSSFQKELESKRNPKTCKNDEKGIPASAFTKIFWIISSPGGDVQSAFEIMELIKKYQMVTFISEGRFADHLGLKKECLSACSLIFSSGVHRHFLASKNHNRVLGIHKPDFAKGTYDYLRKEKELDKLKYEIIDFMQTQGIDPRFVITMFETKSQDMYYENLSNLLIWDVITSLDRPVGMPVDEF